MCGENEHIVLVSDKMATLRVAWLGAIGGGGGVGGIGTLLLKGLLRAGAEVTVFAMEDAVSAELLSLSGPTLHIEIVPSRWKWNRWYSRGKFRAFISGSVARIRAYRRATDLVRQRNAKLPYDVIFQMSQIELFDLGRHLDELPPVVVFPCVHAAGELRWHHNESQYARQSENPIVHYIIRLYLIYRSRVQRRELRKPALIIGMSQRFNELIRQDYGVDSKRQALLYNPINIEGAEPRLPEARETGRPLRLLFVARISVRKGVDQIIELSRRLDDLAGKIEIHVIGGPTMWSDYRGHLQDLNPQVARYLGSMAHDNIIRAYGAADILLLPSQYEPGGIVVGEALSCGVPVVVSNEVGTAEPIDQTCCRRFRAGDIDAFEREVRRLVDEMRVNPEPLRSAARQQAAQYYLPTKVSDEFLAILYRAVDQRAAASHSSESSSEASCALSRVG